VKRLTVCLITVVFNVLFAGIDEGLFSFDTERPPLKTQKSEPAWHGGDGKGGLVRRAWSAPVTRSEKAKAQSFQTIKIVQEKIRNDLELAFFPILVKEESTLTFSYFQKERIDRVSVVIRGMFREHAVFEPFISAQILQIIEPFDLDIKKWLFDELKKKMAIPLPVLNKFLPKLYRHIGFEDVKTSIYAVLYAHITQIDTEEKPLGEKIRKIRDLNEGYVPLSEEAKRIIADIISDCLAVYDETMILESVKRVFLRYNVYPYDVDSILDYLKPAEGKETIVKAFKDDIRSNVIEALKISPREQITRGV